MIPMALVGDDAARQKLLEENLDRLLKNLEASSPVVAKDLIPPEGVEGTYRVSVAPDRFSATVDLFPPLGGGKPLDWITLVDELNGQGFVALLAESLSQAVDRCNQGAPQKGILVAQGIPPKLPREARLEILFSLEAPREAEEPPEDEDSQVDYRDRGTSWRSGRETPWRSWSLRRRAFRGWTSSASPSPWSRPRTSASFPARG